MGIINASPESFYKESITIGRKIISEMAIKMEKDGADIIDIGGMSTAPYGTTLVSASKELERMRNSIMAIKDVSNIPLSVDTPRAEVAKASIDMGVDVINDVTGLKYDKMMRSVISTSGLPVIIGAYGDRSITYQTGDIAETIDILKVSLDMANQSGIKEDKLIVDSLGQVVITHFLQKFPIKIGTTGISGSSRILNVCQPYQNQFASQFRENHSSVSYSIWRSQTDLYRQSLLKLFVP